MCVLAITSGTNERADYPLAPGRSTVGRSEANLIRLQDSTVSLAHAEFVEIGPGKYLLRDLGSTNGTFVNGQAVSETEISAPCSLTFGSIQCQLAPSPAPDVPPLPAEPIEKQRASDAPTKEIEELNILVQQSEQAAQDARKESELLRQALDEAKSKLAFQEQEHKRKLIFAVETERKEREKLGSDHAAQLRKLEADSETQRKQTQVLLSQFAKVREEHRAEIGLHEKAVTEKTQALRDAERDAGLLKQALHDLRIRVTSQEEDSRQKLAAAAEAAQKEREHLSQAHAGQVAELQANVESQRRLAQELQAELERMKEEHQQTIEHLRSTRQTDLTTIGTCHEKRLAELSHEHREKIAEKDRALALLRSQLEPQPTKDGEGTVTAPATLPHSAEEAAVTPPTTDEIQLGSPWAHPPRFAAITVGYLLIFGLGYLLSVSASKPGTQIMERTAAGAPTVSAAEPILSSANNNRDDTRAALGKWVPIQTAAIDSKLPAEALESHKLSPIPSWLAGYQLASALLAQSIDANPLWLLGFRSETTPAQAEPNNAFEDSPTFAAQESKEKLGTDAPILGEIDPEITAESITGSPASSSGAEIRNLPSVTPESGMEPSPLDSRTASACSAGNGHRLTLESIDLDRTEAFAEGDLKLMREPGELLLGSGIEGIGGSHQPLVSLRDNGATDSLDLTNIYLPSGDRQIKDSLAAINQSTETPKPAPLTVLILGDSMSLCGFGKRLDDKLRALPQVKSTFTYMASGTNPLSWLKEKPFTEARTRSGFWSIESVLGKEKPKVFQDTYGMRRGSTPKWHPVPKLEDLLSKIRPDILIVQNGTNLFDLFRDGRTVQPRQQAPLLKHYIEPFTVKVSSPTSPLRKIYWVSSPTSGRVSKEIQDFVFDQIHALTGGVMSIIDSRQLVSYPYRNMAPDREHFIGRDMDQWADKVYDIIQRDISSQSLASLKPLGELLPAATARESNPFNGSLKDTDLYVNATLTFKSEPLRLKELMPYQESLVAYVYAVREVLAGQYGEKNILVMHPAHIGLKSQPLKNYKIGKDYKLRLRELETTQWSTVKTKDDTGAIDLTPYIQVEDDIRIMGHGQETANDAR